MPNDTWKIPYQLNERKKEIVRIRYIRNDTNVDAQANGNTIQMLYKINLIAQEHRLYVTRGRLMAISPLY